jgi:hypothetical protein
MFTASYSTTILVAEGEIGDINSIWALLSGKRFLSSEEAVLFAWSVGLANWVGSVVIPLDWNRSWQKWPIPNSICGSSSVLMYYLLKNWIQWSRRKQVDKDK